MSQQKRFKTLLASQLSPDAFQWLNEKSAAIAAEGEKATALNTAFAAVPRHTGTAVINLLQKEKETFLQSEPPMHISGWTADRLARVWLLLSVDAMDKDSYITKIETLFAAASLNEQVALYSALPLLHHPEAWRHRCAEGIRSNLGPVLQAIMCGNVYPLRYLPDAAWNQMVLKAFFTDKPVQQIWGLDERRNRELAAMLTDYAHERRAAGRPVHPQLWRCVAPFVDEGAFNDIVQLSRSDDAAERKAAVLVCRQSRYAPCKELLQQEALKAFASDENLSWQTLAVASV